MKMKKEIKIKNQVGELVKVNAFIEEIGEELQLDMELLMNLQKEKLPTSNSLPSAMVEN